MKDKSPILILVILFILFGLSYDSIKNSSSNQNKMGYQNKQQDQTTIGKNDQTRTFGYTPNKIIAEDIKNIEKKIKQLEKETAKWAGERERSPYYDKIWISTISGVRDNDPNREYLTLFTRLDKTETINITGWYLKSAVTGYYAIIGKASLLPFPFTRTESAIILQQGDRAIITKGFSPIGISFRTNKCTGYFEENRDFIPRLPLECPFPEDEDLPLFSNIHDRNDECINLIKRIPRCTTRDNEYIRDLSDTVTDSCKNYIATQINYNSCVAKHFGSTDFPGNEYRIYLGKFGPLWRKEREIINLHDQNGLIVDSISY